MRMEEMYGTDVLNISPEGYRAMSPKKKGLLLAYIRRGDLFFQPPEGMSPPANKSEALAMAKASLYWRFGFLQFSWGGTDRPWGELSWYQGTKSGTYRLSTKEIINLLYT